MTGRELKVWLEENNADWDEIEVFFLQDDGMLKEIKPEVWTNEKAKDEYPEVRGMDLPDDGRCVIL